MYGSGVNVVYTTNGTLGVLPLNNTVIDVAYVHMNIYVATNTTVYSFDMVNGSLNEIYIGENIQNLTVVEDLLVIADNTTYIAINESWIEVWRTEFDTNSKIFVSDVNGDNLEDLVVANSTTIGIIYYNGSLEALYKNASWEIRDVSAGNMVGDSMDEIYVLLDSGAVYRVTKAGATEFISSADTTPRFHDFDGDGYEECLVVINNVYSKVYPNGTQVDMFPKEMDIMSIESALIDFELDGNPEYVMFFYYWGETKLGVMKHFRRASIPDISSLAPSQISYEVNKYHKYAEMISILNQLASVYPNRVSIFPIGKSYNVTGEATIDIYAVKITNGDSIDKPNLLIVGAHHARELITAEAALYLIVNLTEQYGYDPVITYILDTFDVYVVPVLNAGGHDYALYFDWLRRNLHPVDEDFDGNFDEDPPEDTNGDGLIDKIWKYVDREWVFWGYEGNDDDGDGRPSEDPPGGVDPNRNYNYSWTNEGDYSDPTADIYSGDGPLSEPETRALSDLMRDTLPIVALSLHSGEETIFYPWGTGYRVIQEKDKIEGLVSTLQSVTGFAAMQSSSIYEAYGVWDDYAYGYFGIIPLTPEIFRNGSALEGELYVEDGEYYYRSRGVKWLFNPRENYIRNVCIKVLRMFVATALWADDILLDNQKPTTEIMASESGGKVSLDIRSQDYQSGVQTVTVEILDSGKVIYLPRDKMEDRWNITLDAYQMVRVIVRDRVGRYTVYYTNGTFTILSPNNGTLTRKSKLEILWSAPYNIQVNTYEVYVNDTSISTIPSGETRFIYTFEESGTYIFRIRMVSEGEYRDSSIVVTYDATPPAVRILSPSNQSIVREQTLNVSWSAHDNYEVSRFEVYVNESLVGETNRSWMLINLTEEGPHVIAVKAIDKVGNSNETRVIVLYDATPPTIRILSPTNNSVLNETNINLSWVAEDNYRLGEFEVYINDSLVVKTNKTWVILNLTKNGTYIISVVAIDAAGNSRTSSIKIRIEIPSEKEEEEAEKPQEEKPQTIMLDPKLIIAILLILATLATIVFIARKRISARRTNNIL